MELSAIALSLPSILKALGSKSQHCKRRKGKTKKLRERSVKILIRDT
jgi:hypothetical protein